MPTSSSINARRPRFDVGNILKLDPENDSRCVGFAHTQGRRCRMPIAGHNLAAAEALLDDINDDLSAGLDIEDLLWDLADRLHCKRWHGAPGNNDQRSRAARAWNKQITAYVREHRTSRQRSAVTRESSSRLLLQDPPASSTRVRTTTTVPPQSPTRPANEPRRTTQASTTATRPSQSNNIQQNSRNIDSRQTTSTSQGTVPQLDAANTIMARWQTDPTSVSHLDVLLAIQSQISAVISSGVLQQSNTSSPPDQRSTIRPTSTPSTASQASTTQSESVESPIPQPATPSSSSDDAVTEDVPSIESLDTPSATVRRMSISGDCPICCESLHAHEDDVDTDDESADDESDDDGSSDSESYSDESGSEDESEDNYSYTTSIHTVPDDTDSITYCQTQCGRNFHTSCISHWLESCADRRIQPTCPNWLVFLSSRLPTCFTHFHSCVLICFIHFHIS